MLPVAELFPHHGSSVRMDFAEVVSFTGIRLQIVEFHFAEFIEFNQFPPTHANCRTRRPRAPVIVRIMPVQCTLVRYFAASQDRQQAFAVHVQLRPQLQPCQLQQRREEVHAAHGFI